MPHAHYIILLAPSVTALQSFWNAYEDDIYIPDIRSDTRYKIFLSTLRQGMVQLFNGSDILSVSWRIPYFWN